MTPLLDIRDLTVTFGDTLAVKGFNIAIEAGQTHALVGESGSGKSAAALSVLRLHPKRVKLGGRILFEGTDVLKMPDAELRRVRGNLVSMIFQEPMSSLNPVLTVGTQVIETLRRHKRLSGAAAKREALDLLDLVRLPDPARLIDRYPHNLSGGQRQRVMIAMAVACRPRLLIADEPTTALDVTIQSEILALIDRLKRELDMAVLLITHDLGLVAEHADHVSVAYAGEIVEAGPVTNVLRAPRHPYTAGLLGASLHLGDARHYRTSRLTEIRKSFEPISGGTRFELLVPALPVELPTRLPQATPALEVRNLRVDYPDRRSGPVTAVDGVSLQIGAGETLGLVGESGCGKSTLSKAIMRLVPAAEGQVLVDGTDMLPLSGQSLREHRRKLQLIFQDPYGSLNPRVSIGTMLDRVQRRRNNLNRRERLAAASSILDKVGLPSTSLDRYPHEFSGGQRQRLVIARALIQTPRIIVCDEPVSALDVSVQAQILNLLSDLKDEFGLSYLFISHDLGVVRYFADRVVVMNKGRIIEEGNHEKILRHPEMDYTRRLIASVPSGRPLASAN